MRTEAYVQWWRNASRGRRRIVVAGAVAVAAGFAVPWLWPDGGGTSGLAATDPTPSPTLTATPVTPGPSVSPEPSAAPSESGPPLVALTPPGGLRVPVRAGSVPAGYGGFQPSVGPDGLGLVAESSTSGGEIVVSITGDKPGYQPPDGAQHDQVAVNGRTADLYQAIGDATLLWQRKPDQWVKVSTGAKSGTPAARDKVLQVARGLVDQETPMRYRVVFGLGPAGYQYANADQQSTDIAPGGKLDTGQDTAGGTITARLGLGTPGLGSGKPFTYHGHPGVITEYGGSPQATVDLGGGTRLDVFAGVDVHLPASTWLQLVRSVTILPGPPPTRP